MRTIDLDTLIGLLSITKGCFPITLVTHTIPDLTAGCPFKGNIVKISHVNGMAGFIYENAVNRQRTREGNEADFEAFPRKWGKRLAGTPLVEHKGEYYLEIKVEKSLTPPSYQDHNSNEISSEDVKPYIRVRDNNGRQELDKPVILRDYKVSSIVSITFGGETYVVKG